MKYFKIEDNKGWYWDGTQHQEIDKINKKDLLNLLNSAEAEDFKLDHYDEKLIANRAHQIIYENITAKFEQFLGDKDQFKKEVNKLYKEAMGKYAAKAEDKDGYTSDAESENEENPDDIPF